MKAKKFVFCTTSSGDLTVQDAQNGKLYDLYSGQDGLLECGCTFSSAFPGLPCCHLLFSKQERSLPLSDASVIPDRWNRSSFDGTSLSSAEADAELEVVGGAAVENTNDCDFSSAEEDIGRRNIFFLLLEMFLISTTFRFHILRSRARPRR